MKAGRLRTMMAGILLLAGILGVGGYAALHAAKFGAFPEGERLRKIAASPNYGMSGAKSGDAREGEFRNLEPIPSMTTEKKGVVQGLIAFLTSTKDRPRPASPVPTVKTDLKALPRGENVLIWLGHSSFYIQLAGQRILVDPVFSDNAAPLPLVNRAFAGSNIYTAQDMPDIDLLLITHDHWDHLDYPTVTALQPKVRRVVCPLGVGAHFARWGYADAAVVELDWHEALPLGDSGVMLHSLPARHYSGRTLTRNKTLWAAYALISPAYKLYLSGDTGYGAHFAQVGENFDGFDLALLDSGQYNEDWRYVHMMPEDTVQAALDLRAGALLPAHVGKFSIARHAWDEPFERIVRASSAYTPPLRTPKIGEPLPLEAAPRTFAPWWKEGAFKDEARAKEPKKDEPPKPQSRPEEPGKDEPRKDVPGKP